MNGLMKKMLLPVLVILLLLSLAQQARWFAAGSDLARPLARLKGARMQAPPSGAARVTAEGRVVAYPGAEVSVGTDIAGVIERLVVEEKDRVRQGMVLAELRSDDLRAELAEARARVAEAEADIRLFDIEVERARKLWEARVGTRQALDRALRDRDAAAARQQTAAASVRRLEATLAKTRIVSPIDGVVVGRNVHPGEPVDSGDRLLTIADLRRTRLEAEVDEFDTGRVRLGAEVTITAEGYPGQVWRGRVEEIPDSVVARTLKPQDPGRFTDTRVLLVKIAPLEPTPLKLGQRIGVTIEEAPAASAEMVAPRKSRATAR